MYTQHQFDRIFNHSLIGIGLVDKDYRIERCNIPFRRIFGLEAECDEFRLLDEPKVCTKVHGRLLPSDSIHLDLCLDFDELIELGYLVSTRDGVRSIEMIVSPISLETGKQGYLVQAQEAS